MTTVTTYDLVRREVTHCVSPLISTLASSYGESGLRQSDDLFALLEQAFELASPVLDYEEAARDHGYVMNEERSIVPSGDCEGFWEDWQSCCEANGIEPYEREVFEHWIVSHWLADKLIEHGEKVDKNFQGMCVWARTTTGQAIAMDYVIEQIAQELSNG